MTVTDIRWALNTAIGAEAGDVEGRKRATAASLEFEALLHENNMLRRNNERLSGAALGLRRELDAALSDKRAAQTMAAHWRIEARGGDYDATKEEQP